MWFQMIGTYLILVLFGGVFLFALAYAFGTAEFHNAMLTCFHCGRETPVGPKTCQRCGRELQ